MKWLAGFIAVFAILFPAAHATPVCCGPPTTTHVDGRSYIMPLGDSTTFGANDAITGTGYRGPLASMLNTTPADWAFVGTVANGTILNNEHDGWPGWTISQLNNAVPGWLPHPPPTIKPTNRVLVCAGTNDALHGATGVQMLTDMSVLLNTLLNFSATMRVAVAQLPPLGAAPGVAVRAYNAGLPTLAASKGIRVRVVDMSATQIGGDGIHPTMVGYRYMAVQWFTALKGWVYPAT